MRRGISIGLAVLLLVALIGNGGKPAMAAGTTYFGSQWNGIIVYLSPANQPGNVGCDGYVETDGARLIATAAKDWLINVGYGVRIGLGTYIENTSDSNSTSGVRLHVPIHSNAPGKLVDWDCAGTDPTKGGTHVYYYKASDQAPSQALYNELASASPGTADVRKSFDAYELVNTTRPAAYVEAEFHTYGPGVTWLRQSTTVGTLIAQGIDQYFGMPRCGVNIVCTQSVPIDPVPLGTEATPATSVEHEHALVNATPHQGLQAALSSKLSAEFGLENAVLSVMVGEGVAVVDFSDFSSIIPGASSGAGKSELMSALNTTVFQFPDITQVAYRFDGSCQAFGDWLQSGCVSVSRSSWSSR